MAGSLSRSMISATGAPRATPSSSVPRGTRQSFSVSAAAISTPRNAPVTDAPPSWKYSACTGAENTSPLPRAVRAKSSREQTKARGRASTHNRIQGP